MLGECPHRTEPGIDDRHQACLGAAGHDRVGIPSADCLECFADRSTAGGAGGHHRHIRPAQAEGDGDVSRGGVREHVLDEGGTDSPKSALLQDSLLLE